jgi:hypothetical protein
VLALTPWKQLIVRRGLTRRGRRGLGAVLIKVSSIGLGVAVLVSLAAGLAHSYAGRGDYAGLSAMQIHVGAAVIAAPLFIVHLVSRPQRVRRSDLSRRNLLKFGAVLGAGAIAYAALEGLAKADGLPGRLRRATGSYERGTDDPTAMPLTSWLFDAIPAIDLDTYRLTIRSGPQVTRIAYSQLAAGTDEVRAILDCTGGWYAAQTWRGVRLDRLLPSIPAGHVIVVTSATGYRRRFPAAEASSLWLATTMANAPLNAGHGAPARLVAPGRRGFWWVKWVVSVEAEPGPDWWQPPFPLQ